jgi:hypothetical protein
MSCHTCVDEWTTIIHTQLPLLSKSQATVLALWSRGMVLARSCALSAVSVWLAALRAQGADRAPTVARMVLRGRGQTGHLPPSPGGGTLCCAATALGAQSLAGHAAGPGPRCDPAGHALCGVSHQRGVSRLCDPRRLDDPAGQYPTRLAPALAAPAAPAAAGHPPALDRHCAGRSGAVCRLVVSSHRPAGLASLLAHQCGGTFRPDPQAVDRPLTSCVPHLGTRWRGTGTAFKSRPRRLRCTLLACWEEGYTAPWLILTDLPPEASEAVGMAYGPGSSSSSIASNARVGSGSVPA